MTTVIFKGLIFATRVEVEYHMTGGINIAIWI
jgi:hypothetical protein